MAATSGTTKLKVRWALVGCVGICILARAVQLSARPSVRTVCAQRGGCADVPRACTFALYRFPLLPWSLLTLP